MKEKVYEILKNHLPLALSAVIMITQSPYESNF